MNVLALTVPLTRLLTCSNLCASAAASSPCFVLNASADWQPLLAGDLGLLLVVFAHGSGFPLTDAAPHELWAVGFPNIFPPDKKIEHAHVAAVIIHIELSALESREQAGANIPASLKRESVA
jgi:hypothetical protein